MSSLQKFHRRTNNITVISPFPNIGDGSATIGYWAFGTIGSKIIVAPKSTEQRLQWGSSGITRGVFNTTNGLSNTNTLYALGSAAHPAAYYCKTLTQGGYNTWYLPAATQLDGCYTNKSVGSNVLSFAGDYVWSSTEYDSTHAYNLYFGNGNPGTLNGTKAGANFYGNQIPWVRAIRLSTI